MSVESLNKSNNGDLRHKFRKKIWILDENKR